MDFFTRKNTEYREVEFERRCLTDFEGLAIYVTSPEDLILSKLEWAKESLSEMQIRDVKNLLMTSGLDMDYIRDWVRRLGLEEIFRKALISE